MAAIPRCYQIIRHGQPCRVVVHNRRELIDLRMELEIGRRFATGVGPGHIRALDHRIARLRENDASAGTRAAIENVQEMREILQDASSPKNIQAIAEIDRDFQDVKAVMMNDSINQDSSQFHEDVSRQIEASDVDEVDALLASLAEATQQATQPDAASDETAHSDLDALEALAQEVTVQAAKDNPEADAGQAQEETGIGDNEVAAILEEVTTEKIGAGSPPEAASAREELPAEEVARPISHTDAEMTAADGERHVDGEIEVEVNAEVNAEAEGEGETTADASDAVESNEIISAGIESGEIETDETEMADTGDALKDPPANTDTINKANPAHLIEADHTDADIVEAELAALTDTLSQGVTDAKDEIDAIASAFEEAAVELDTRPPNIQPESENSAEPAVPARSTRTSDAGKNLTSALRSKLKNTRSQILSELDEIMLLLEQVEQTQQQAEESVAKAREFESAARQAHQAGEELTSAEAETAKARAILEQATARVENARQNWKKVQKRAVVAARAAEEAKAALNV